METGFHSCDSNPDAVQKYVASDGKPPKNQQTSTMVVSRKAKQKVRQEVEDIADDLIQL